MNDRTKPMGVTSDEDESGLLLTSLTTRASRNAVEMEAIGRTYEKHVFRGRKKTAGSGWLTESYIRQVHEDMFGGLWDWAGKYRQTDLNIGVAWHTIPEQIKILCDDFRIWDSLNSGMSVLEISARLQNRLTKIHPFKNGNGRHARLLTDIFFHSHKHPLPEWPQIQLLVQGDDIRKRYISAMKKADEGDFQFLMDLISEWLPSTKK